MWIEFERPKKKSRTDSNIIDHTFILYYSSTFMELKKLSGV